MEENLGLPKTAWPPTYALFFGALALLAALSLLGTTALAAGLPEETIAAQTELCGEDCGHTHEEVFSHTEHTEESLPEPEEIAVPVATPLLEQPEPEAEQSTDTSGVIPGSGIHWELNEYGWLMLSGSGACPVFTSPDDQPWAAVREQITQVWFEDMDALSIPSLAYWFTGCTALTMAEIPYTTPVIGAAAFADCPSLRQIQLYYSGTFTIVPGAFSTGSLTPLLGLLGTMAVNQQMAFFSDALGHSALTGIGLGILLGVSSDLLAMLVFGIVWALLICRIKQTGAASTDTIISVFSSTSVAAGVLVLSMGGGFAKYSSLLVGDVLAVQDSDLLYLLIALVAGIALWAVMYNSLLLSGISPSLARSRGIHNRLVECAFVVLVAVAVMLAIRWVGVMLINALLILPAAAGRNLARSSRQHAVYSVVIALVCGVAGLICAYYLDTTAGAAIVLFAAVCYAISLGIRALRK